MLIGELSKKSGFTRDTIRFYEKQGLIAQGCKTGILNSYKTYPAETLVRLEIIGRMKNLGFTLKEVAGFLDMIEMNEDSCDRVSHKLHEKIAAIDRKIRELNEVRDLISGAINHCRTENNMAKCPILVTAADV